MYGPRYQSNTRYDNASFPGNRTFTFNQTSYRMGSKKRLIPLPYYMLITKSNGELDAPNTGAGYAVQNGISPIDEIVPNKALAKFVTAARDGSSASLAVTLAEWKQSHNMIVRRAEQLIRATKALARRDLNGLRLAFAGDSRVSQRFGHGSPQARQIGSVIKNRDKSLADLWLELHFGWVPLINDLYSAIDVLSSTPSARRVKVRSSGIYESTVNPGYCNKWNRTLVYEVKVTIGADISVDNPNLLLLNQLGLVNPLTVAWEVIPFSFLVDWFIPVGAFLDSFTNLVGVSVVNPFTTTLRRAISSDEYMACDGYGRKLAPTPSCVGSEAIRMTRVLSIPSYKLNIPSFKGLSVSRGATAVSLLIQQFANMSNRRALR